MVTHLQSLHNKSHESAVSAITIEGVQRLLHVCKHTVLSTCNSSVQCLLHVSQVHISLYRLLSV